VVLMAAGIGITPFMALLEDWAADPAPTGMPRLLLHGSRTVDARAYAARVAELAAAVPGLEVQAFCSRSPGDPASGLCAGRVGAASVAQRWIEAASTFHVCGPPSMSRETIAGLLARGVPRHDIFSESFQLAPEAPPVDPQGRHVRFARSDIQVRWGAGDTSLLALADRVGVALAGGCRVGQCETCRVALRSGAVWHRAEAVGLGAGECLACIAVPITDLEVDA